MTQAGQPIDLGGIEVRTPVKIGGSLGGSPIVVPGGAGQAATALDDLRDVDAPVDQPGLLERQGDGKVRPVPRADVQSDWFSGDGPPPDVVPGAGYGDFYVDNLTGNLYRLT